MVSIALATYNGGKYLREQLDSFYSQSYKNIEVVVSDDCSTDDSIDILKEYKKKYKLKYSINKKNLGFVKNFERAISMCSGEFIALSDQDDIWFPDKIKTLLSEIGDFSLICSDAVLINSIGDVISQSFQRFSKNFTKVDGQFKFFVFRNFVTGCTSLIKKEVIDKALPIPEGIRYHDWWFALIASTLNSVKYLDMPLVKYRQHDENDTGANKKINILSKIKEAREKENAGVFEKEKLNLRAMINSGKFTDEQKSVINDRLVFYENLQARPFHWKSFRIAVKHRKNMLAGRSFFYKLVFIISSLIK